MIIKKNQNIKKCGLINFPINYNYMNLKQINREIDMKKKFQNQKIEFNNTKLLMKIKLKNCYNLWLIKNENTSIIYYLNLIFLKYYFINFINKWVEEENQIGCQKKKRFKQLKPYLIVHFAVIKTV